MLISIIVPFYNVEPYFRRCLDSIVNQTYRNLEIILVNDCSPDNCIAIAREYAAKDDRIIIIEHEKNLGLGGARNSGMGVAKGEYIWFIDSDDLIINNYAVEQLVDIAKGKYPEVIMFNSHTLVDNGYTERTYSYYPYADEQHFDEDRPFAPVFSKILLTGDKSQGYFGAEVWAKWFHRDFIKKIQFKFLEHTMHEDEPLLIALGLAQKVVISPITHYYYYQRATSSMNSKLPADYDQHVKRVVEAICHTSLHHPLKHRLEPNTGIIYALYILVYKMRTALWRISAQEQLKVYHNWYNILAELPELRHALLSIEKWPAELGKEQAWRSLLQSFAKPTSTIEQRSLWISIIEEDKRKDNPLKKAIKMLLPYGVIRVVQVIKKKRNQGKA